MPVVASVTVPKVRINPGSRTFGPYAAPNVPLTGLVFTSLRNTSAAPSRRGDTTSSVYSILFEGQRASDALWQVLGAFAFRGGIYVFQSEAALRALKGTAGEELNADRFSSSLAEPTLFSNLRVSVTVSGGRYEGKATLELLGA